MPSTSRISYILIPSVLLIPSLVAAAGIDPATVNSYATGITDLINKVFVPLLFTLAFIVFLYGVAKAYIFSGGSETERAQGHKLILWGVIGFFVMLAVWGLVNVLISTFGLTGGTAPKPPTI